MHRSGYDSRSESGADTDIGQWTSSRAARPAQRSRQAQQQRRPGETSQLKQHAATVEPPGASLHTEADVEGKISRLCMLTLDMRDKQQYRAEFKRVAARGSRTAAPPCTAPA